jgi:hypothetical protein
MPAHSSHILQPLDVVCFAPLKLKYSQRVRDLARRRVFHINKEGFLPAFKDAFFDVFTTENCKKAFEAAGLVPLNHAEVIDRLDVRLRTPPQPPTPETPWQSKTPSNVHEFGSQSKLIRDSITTIPSVAHTGLEQLVKGAELMAHRSALMGAWITELEEQLAVMTKRKSRKRKRIQTGGTLEYGEAADQAVTQPSSTVSRPSKTVGVLNKRTAPSTQCRCGQCGGTGHNARTCQGDAAGDSELSASTQYIFSSSVASDNDDANS